MKLTLVTYRFETDDGRWAEVPISGEFYADSEIDRDAIVEAVATERLDKLLEQG